MRFWGVGDAPEELTSVTRGRPNVTSELVARIVSHLRFFMVQLPSLETKSNTPHLCSRMVHIEVDSSGDAQPLSCSRSRSFGLSRKSDPDTRYRRLRVQPGGR